MRRLKNTGKTLDYRPPHLLHGSRSRASLAVAALLLLAIAMADYQTGYSLRLSPLHMVPIAIAAWVGGTRSGIVMAVAASLLWLFSFRYEHLYLNHGFYIWEALAMLTGFVVVVWLVVRLHRALSQADERFVRVLEEMRAAVYVADEQRDTFLYANPELHRLDARVDQLTPSNFEQQFADESGLRLSAVKPAGNGFTSRPIKHVSTERWYLLQEGPIPWGNAQHVKLKVLTEITEQKNSQQTREMHTELVHQSSRLTTLAEIASTLAHEINQPLMVIATYTDACQRLLRMPQADPQEIIDVLGKCHAQAVRASSIIERLREFIRQRSPQPARWQVRTLISEALDVSRPLLEEARISVDSSRVDKELTIVADRVLLVQVMVNLIRNAIDAMAGVPQDKRRLVITAALAAEEKDVLITVADRGTGLGDLPAEKMFAPFVTTKGQGLGLGLAISRSVAESHDGSLWATENPEGGAIFHLSIPHGNTD